MGTISQQTREEFRSLPLLLGKLLGGLLAVTGFAAAVLLETRQTPAAPGALWLSLLSGGAGVLVFVLAGRSLARRERGHAVPATGAGMNRLAWGLLLLLALLFLLCSYQLTR